MPSRFVEADNALGSPRGDVDDGLALAALFGSCEAELVVGSTFGNTTEAEADRNNRALAAVCGARVQHVRGSAGPGRVDAEAVAWLCASGHDARVLMLGPLTTLAAALARAPGLAFDEVVIVGGDLASRGRLPPVWPHEFNFWLDRPAAAAVFASRLPLTLVPLDVGRRLLVPSASIAAWPGTAGAHVRRHVERRLRRNRRWLRRDALRGYDLLAAAACCLPAAVERRRLRVAFRPRGYLRAGTGPEVDVVTDFDGAAIGRWLVEAFAAIERRGAQTLGARGAHAADRHCDWRTS